jgi:hypothetical protein
MKGMAMKKILIVLGIVFLAVIAGVAALLIWAGASGSAMQEQFFTAVLSGDPGQVTTMFHSALREEVDEPVLATWMVVVKKNLGSYQGLSKTDFNTSTKYKDGQKVTESSGMVNFEKGQAHTELVFRDGKLVKFLVKSDKLPDDWFTGPAGTELYRERGKEFLARFMSNKPDAGFSMMHPALKDKMPLDKLTKLAADTCSKAGKLRTITYQSEKYDPKEKILKVHYTLECENASAKPLVEFEFVGLKGHLIAFNLSGD